MTRSDFAQAVQNLIENCAYPMRVASTRLASIEGVKVADVEWAREELANIGARVQETALLREEALRMSKGRDARMFPDGGVSAVRDFEPVDHEVMDATGVLSRHICERDELAQKLRAIETAGCCLARLMAHQPAA